MRNREQIHSPLQRRFLLTGKALYKHAPFYLLLVPAVTYFIIWHYAPMYGVTIAFKDYKISLGIMNSPWIGLQNFRDLFNAYAFENVMKNTVIISFYRLVFGFPAPIIFALFLNEIRLKFFKRTVQTISYLPHFISWVILSGIVIELLSPTTGPVNAVLQAFGVKPIYFMVNKGMFRSILIISGIWAEIGWSSIIYFSAVANVDVEQYEAASIDGANRLQAMWHLTLPSIMPVISITLLLKMAGILEAGFDQIFNMQNDMVRDVSDILDTYVYRTGLVNIRYSFATAVGLFKNLIGLVALLITNFVIKRVSDEQNQML